MISSFTNEKIKDAIKLKQKKYRDQTNLFLVEGFHLVEEAIFANVCKTIFYIGKKPSTSVDTIEVSPEIIKKLSDVLSPQGIVAICEKPESNTLTNQILMLDHIQDPGNLGTLLRSAKAFGFQTIIMDQCVDIYNQKVIRGSQGALFSLNYIETSILSFMETHQEYFYIGTNLKESTDLSKYKHKSEKTALILGNEGSGVSQEILEKTNINLKISMNEMESLNVSIAGSIIMYNLSQVKE